MTSSDTDRASAKTHTPGQPVYRDNEDRLPARPVIVIDSHQRSLDLLSLWHTRELLYVLTLREIKVRYKQTLLGILWAVIQPLAGMLVFTFFFGRLAGMPSDGIPYALFALGGLIPWTFFSNAVATSSNSLVNNSNLITKVYFPRMIIPLAAVCAGLVDLGISFGLLFLLLILYGIVLTPHLLMLPFLAILTVLLAAGVGMWMAALNVRYRDIRHALPFFVQLWLFITPIIYPLSFVPEQWRWLLLLNPLTGLVEGYRSALFGNPIDARALGISTVAVLLICAYSMYRFRKLERSFADII